MDNRPRLDREPDALDAGTCIAEGQRFTTAILAERLPSAVPRGQVTPPQGSAPVAPH